MNGQHIQIVEKVTYLGVILDKKLTFRAHTDFLAMKANKLLTRISMAMRPTWGPNSGVLNTVYRCAVELLVLYRVPTFSYTLNKKWEQTKLLQVQSVKYYASAGLMGRPPPKPP